MTAVMPDYTISKRVRAIWKKFCDWYGADVIAKKLGAVPAREWCEEIDSIATRDELAQVLADVRSKHVNWPPLFPQFEAICKSVRRPQQRGRAPSVAEQLSDYVIRTKRLTRAQLGGWTFFGGAGDAFAGVVVPADPETGAPGYRVTVADMQLGDSL